MGKVLRRPQWLIALIFCGLTLTFWAGWELALNTSASQPRTEAPVAQAVPEPNITPEERPAIEPAHPDLLQLEALLMEGDYEECINLEPPVLQESSAYTSSQNIGRICRGLVEAQTLEAKGEFEDAMAVVANLPDHFAVQRHRDRICQRLLRFAEQYYFQADPQYLNHAEYSLNAISMNSACYETVQQKQREWRQEYINNTEVLEEARIALEREEMAHAETALDEITSHPYWQSEARPLQREIEAHRNWQRANSYLAQGELDNAREAANRLPNDESWLSKKNQILRELEDLENQWDWSQIMKWALYALIASGLLRGVLSLDL